MKKEAIGIAETVDQAKEKALEELGASFDDDIQVEVLSLPRKKALGIFGGSQAKVKVSIEIPDPKPAKSAKQFEKKSAKPVVKKAEEKDRQNSKPAANKKSEGTPASEIDENTPAGRATKYLSSILNAMDCSGISVTVNDIEGGSQIMLNGENLGIVVGHRGETLDALQYLASLAANSGSSGYYRIVLNTGNYRQKREQTLIALANRMSEQAIKSGKCRTLEPMNPYERRIIHTTVQEIEGVTSTSFGEGNGRRVVIAPEGKEPRPRREYSNGHTGYRKGYRSRTGRPQHREEYKPEIDPDRAPVKDADALPLYGRIDK